jgi:hypothetical protein
MVLVATAAELAGDQKWFLRKEAALSAIVIGLQSLLSVIALTMLALKRLQSHDRHDGGS